MRKIEIEKGTVYLYLYVDSVPTYSFDFEDIRKVKTKSELKEYISESVSTMIETKTQNGEIVRFSKKEIEKIKMKMFRKLIKRVKENVELCPVCNEEVDDEKYAGGLWDLAAKICDEIGDPDLENQEIIYDTLQEGIKVMGYCPNCGRRLANG